MVCIVIIYIIYLNILLIICILNPIIMAVIPLEVKRKSYIEPGKLTYRLNIYEFDFIVTINDFLF